MPFDGFGLFGDLTRNYLNTELTNTIGRTTRAGTDKLLGLVPGGRLRNLVRFGLGNFGYLVDTVTGERMIFQYNTIASETCGVDYADQATLGRSVPMFHYKGGKARELSLPIALTMREYSRHDVRRNVRWLQSLCYPDYQNDSQVSRSPHPVVLVQGKLYNKDTWLVRDCNIEWGQTMDPINMLPESATVTLTLVETSKRGKSAGEVMFL